MDSKYLIDFSCPNEATSNRKREYISLIMNLSLKLLFSLITGRSKNDASEFEVLSFLSCNSGEYIFLKFLSNFRWLLVVYCTGLVYKTKHITKKACCTQSLFLVSNNHFFHSAVEFS